MTRRFPLFTRWVLAIKKVFPPWLEAHLSHTLAVGLLSIGLLAYGATDILSPFMAFKTSFLVWDGVLPTLAHAFYAIMLTLVGVFALLSSAAYSFRVRRCLESVSSLLADIPALGGAVLALLTLPYALAVVFISAFSLSVRLVHTILACERTISPSYVKTAQSLRLSPWHYFWHVHFFLSFPAIITTIRRDMPEFWLRLLGTQAIAALLTPHFITGCGAQMMVALKEHHLGQGGVIFLLTLAIIALFYSVFFTPLLVRSKRYDLAFLASGPPPLAERRYRLWWKDIRVITVVSLLLVSLIPLGLSRQPWHAISMSGWRILYHTLPILGGCVLFSCAVGGLLIGRKNEGRFLGQFLSTVGALIPFFLFFPLMPSHSVLFFCIALSVQGVFGWSLFFSHTAPMAQKLYQTALDLRLSHVSLWRYLYLPLMLPKLAEGIIASLTLVWSQLYLAEITSRLTIFSQYEGAHFFSLPFYGDQLALISLMTLMIFGLRHGIAIPLQRHIARKYKVPS